MKSDKVYIAIDLKSFYASVECVDRGLDPLTTNLVVADASRTEKTICLAVSPSLKSYGIGGRARLFEVVQRVKEINNERRCLADWQMEGKTYDDTLLKTNNKLELEYIVAPPRMAHYIDVSTKVYQSYLKYISPEDMHIYSIDEVLIDATEYILLYKMTPRQLAMKLIKEVLESTGITATAGIGTNLYLAKVAMDIVAKHVPPDNDGVRIGELDELTYRQKLWNHKPLTDFWRVGKGVASKLLSYGIDTMGKLARLSLRNENLLYQLFGVNAELLIDHAWGWEPCSIDYIKAYKPDSNSFSNGQVLNSPYDIHKARVVVKEMADNMSLHLVEKKLVTDQIVLTIGYDKDSLKNMETYKGVVTTDFYGRETPKPAHGTKNLEEPTSASSVLIEATTNLYDQIVNLDFLIRRLNLTVNHVVKESDVTLKPQQLELFTIDDELNKKTDVSRKQLKKERKLQEAQIEIKKRFGKNALLKGFNFEDGATAKERNEQIGGHKA